MQAFFWTISRQFNSTGVAGFWVFLEFWLEFFQDFAWVLSFFMSFLGIFQKSAGIFKFLKIFDDKKAVFRSTFKFSPWKWFLPAAKRHGQGKVWVGIVLLLWTIVTLVCFSFIFAMCVGILGQHGTVPKLSRSFTCDFYLQILLANFDCNFTCFSRF